MFHPLYSVTKTTDRRMPQESFTETPSGHCTSVQNIPPLQSVMNVQQYEKCIYNQFSNYELDDLHIEATIHPPQINTVGGGGDTEEAQHHDAHHVAAAVSEIIDIIYYVPRIVYRWFSKEQSALYSLTLFLSSSPHKCCTGIALG